VHVTVSEGGSVVDDAAEVAGGSVAGPLLSSMLAVASPPNRSSTPMESLLSSPMAITMPSVTGIGSVTLVPSDAVVRIPSLGEGVSWAAEPSHETVK
jgi:hypothetical protein